MHTTRGRLSGAPAGGVHRRRPVAVSAALAVVTAVSAGALAGCSTTDVADTPGVVVASTSSAVIPPGAPSTVTTSAPTGSARPTPTVRATPPVRDDSTPTTSSAPRVTGTQTQPPGAVVILPIKPSDRSPAAARAVDTAVAYLRAESGVDEVGDTDEVRALSTADCQACVDDIRLLQQRLDAGERVVDLGPHQGFKYLEVKYLGRVGNTSTVSATVIEGPAKVVDRSGKTLQRTTVDTTALYRFAIVDGDGRAQVQSFTAVAR